MPVARSASGASAPAPDPYFVNSLHNGATYSVFGASSGQPHRRLREKLYPQTGEPFPYLGGTMPSGTPPLKFLATARCPTAGVALHAGAVAHQRVVTAFAAGFAFITLHLCFNTGVHGHRTTADCCA